SAWDAPARARAEAAFVATGRPSARAAFARVDAALRGKLDAWAAARRDACEATRVRHVQSEALLGLRTACLDRIHGQLRAFGESPGQDVDADAMDRAVTASAQPLDVGICSELAALREPEAVPADGRLTGEIDRLQADLELGRIKPATLRSRALVDEVHA